MSLLWDTGAQLSCLSEQSAKQCGVMFTGRELEATGVGGNRITLRETQKLKIRLGDGEVTFNAVMWVGPTPDLLGWDALKYLQGVTLTVHEERVEVNIWSFQKNELKGNSIWTMDKDECGLLDMEPATFTGKSPPYTKPYKINKEAEEGVRPVIQKLLAQGIVRKTHSTSNSPIWPVKKASGAWRFTVDYSKANQHINRLTPLVADPSAIFQLLTPEHQVFSVIDMANAFWSVPLHPEVQDWLAFVDGEQYTWTRLPQGFHNSPTVYHMALVRHLRELPPVSFVVIQYVDDILIVSPDAETHKKDLQIILDHLVKKGHRASYSKAQLCLDTVIYLGQKISPGKRELTEDWAQAIRTHPSPNTVRELRSFLGLCNFNRNWVGAFSERAKPLTDLLKGGGRSLDPIAWSPEVEHAFNDLKQALLQAPALGFPQTDQPFYLYVGEKNGFWTAVLTQEHGGRYRPVGYYSGSLDEVARGWGPCLRAVQAVCLAVQAVNNIVLDQQLIVRCPHAVHTLMSLNRVSQVNAIRWSKWWVLLEAPNITIEREGALNPATLLPDPSEAYMLEHSCDVWAMGEDEGIKIAEQPLRNEDLILFTDGTSFINSSEESGLGCDYRT
uniref:ribonuclease H n=1 Tax=Lepisosteus oculatus TaxID=7918 RepID=W5NLS4_LEPOC